MFKREIFIKEEEVTIIKEVVNTDYLENVFRSAILQKYDDLIDVEKVSMLNFNSHYMFEICFNFKYRDEERKIVLAVPDSLEELELEECLRDTLKTMGQEIKDEVDFCKDYIKWASEIGIK